MSRYDWPQSTDVLRIGPYTASYSAAGINGSGYVLSDQYGNARIPAGDHVLQVYAILTTAWAGVNNPILSVGVQAVAGGTVWPLVNYGVGPYVFDTVSGTSKDNAAFPTISGDENVLIETSYKVSFDTTSPAAIRLPPVAIAKAALFLVAQVTYDAGGTPTAGSADVYAMVAVD